MTVDGHKVEIDADATVLDAAEKLGIEIPTLCHYAGVFEEATCRMCVIELVAKGRPGKIVSSCAYPVSEGLVVETDNEKVRRNRRLALELIFSSHRMKCQSCPRKGGNCQLLELGKRYGVEGIPVCSECSLHGDDCLLAKGETCLGPLTVAGCGGVCMKMLRVCEGCRGPVTRLDTVREALRLYDVYGIEVEEVRRKLGKYYANSEFYSRLLRAMEEVMIWK